MDAAAYLTSTALGQRSFVAIYGAITLAYGLGSAIGPAAVGALLSTGAAPSGIFLGRVGPTGVRPKSEEVLT